MSAPRTSRGLMGLAGAAVAGGVSAALFAVALTHPETVLILISYLTAIPLFLAGLGAGSMAGLVASAAAAVGLYLTGPSNYAFVYVFIFAIPAIALTALALHYRLGEDKKVYWYPEGYLLTAIAFYPCVIFLAACGLLSGHEGGLLALTIDAFRGVADQVSKQLDADQATLIHTALERMARVAPAVVGGTWVIVTILGIFIAQYVLQKQDLNLRDGFSLRTIHVPTWLIYAVAATGLVGVLAPAPYDYIGKNLSLMLGIPFVFVGLAVVHAWVATTSWPRLFLAVFYIVLSVFVWLALLVTLLGVIDQWIDFRGRMARIKKPV